VRIGAGDRGQLLARPERDLHASAAGERDHLGQRASRSGEDGDLICAAAARAEELEDGMSAPEDPVL
jgi:hypothetical protein